ncbi:MAG: hypothetical protein V1746_06520 [bacterium]
MIRDIQTSVSGAASVSAELQAFQSLQGSLAGSSYTEASLSYEKTGLMASVQGVATVRASLCGRFALPGAQLSGAASVKAALGVRRSRLFDTSASDCDFFLIEADGRASGAGALGLGSRWERRAFGNEDEAEWTEGDQPIMSSSPTMIINPGAPLTGGGASRLWIDACAYDPAVTWPSSGAKNKVIEAHFSSAGRGFEIESLVRNPIPYETYSGWVVPDRNYLAQYKGENRFEIRLADTSHSRGLRLGYAYSISSDRVELTQAGDATLTARGTARFEIPAELQWTLQMDYYIKTSCDFDDPASERNVAHAHHEATLKTKIFDAKVDGDYKDQPIFNLGVVIVLGTDRVDMNQGLMDAGMERHVANLWEQLDNFVHPEEQWQMYPVRLDEISMKATKRNGRIDFQLSNQYPTLTYVDPFVDRVLEEFTEAQSPADITQTLTATPV